MNEELFERIRFLLERNGPLTTSEIISEFDIPRKNVLEILEGNPYTFDFSMHGASKKWKISR